MLSAPVGVNYVGKGMFDHVDSWEAKETDELMSHVAHGISWVNFTQMHSGNHREGKVRLG